MTWKKLLPTSLLSAAFVALAISFAMPGPAEAVPSCEAAPGSSCSSTCVSLCPNGSCCEWEHKNYPN